MIGFLGPGDQDKFITPLNTNPNEPDMYGLEYLANIVAQVLEDK
jgi:CHASE2 domain-containing sensor protein